MLFNAKTILSVLLLSNAVSAAVEHVDVDAGLPVDLDPDVAVALEAGLPVDLDTDVDVTASLEPRADSQTYTSDSYFKSYALAAHNYYRSQHSAPALTWNADRATIAQNYANNCVFKHSGAKSAGENIAIGYPNMPAVVNAWGQERTKYNYNSPKFSSATGHFTQVVWKSTTQVGCGRKKCSGGWFVVCQYTPPGNYAGQFSANVGRQVSGQPTDKYVPPPISRVKRFAA